MASKSSSATPTHQYQLNPTQQYLFYNTIYNNILQISTVNQTQKTICYECRFINTGQIVNVKLINYVGVKLVDIKEGTDIREDRDRDRDRVGVQGCQVGFWELQSIGEEENRQQTKDQNENRKSEKLCRFLLQTCLFKLQLQQQRLKDKGTKPKTNLLHDANGVLYSNMIVYKKQTEISTYLCQCGRYSKGLTVFEAIKLKNLLKNLHFRGLSYHNLDANSIACISIWSEQPDKEAISLKIDDKIHIAHNQSTFQQQLLTLQQIIKQYFSPSNQCQSQTQSIPNLHPITPPSSPLSQPHPHLHSQFQPCTFLPTFLHQPQISIYIEELPNLQNLQQQLKNSKLIKNNKKLDEGELSWYKEKYNGVKIAKKCMREGLIIGDWEQQSRYNNKIQLLMKDYWGFRKGQYKAGSNSQLGWGDLDIRSSFQDEPAIFEQNLQKYIKSLTGLLHFKKCRKAYHFYSAKLNQRRCNFLIALHHLKQLWLLLESESIKNKDYNTYLNSMTERHVVCHEMARILLQTKKVKECLEWYQRSLKLKQIIHGMYSPTTLSTLYNILYVLIQHYQSISFLHSQSGKSNCNQEIQYHEVKSNKMISKYRMQNKYEYNKDDKMRQQQMLREYVEMLSKVKHRITNEQVLIGWLNSVEVRKSAEMISIVEQHIQSLYSDPWRQAQTRILANKKNMKILSQQQKQGPNTVNSSHNQNRNISATNQNIICFKSNNDIQQLINCCEVGFIWEHTFIQRLAYLVAYLVASIQQSPNNTQSTKQKQLKVLKIIQNLQSKPLEVVNIYRIGCLKNYIELSLGSTNKIDQLHQLKTICTSLSQLISSSTIFMTSQKMGWLGYVLMGVKEVVYQWEWRVYEQWLAEEEIHVDGLDCRWIVECYYEYPQRAANLPYKNTINLENAKNLNKQFTNTSKQNSLLLIDDKQIKLIQYCLLVLKQYKNYTHIINQLKSHQKPPLPLPFSLTLPSPKTNPSKHTISLIEYLLGLSNTVVQEYSKGISHMKNLLQLHNINPSALVNGTNINQMPMLIRIEDQLNYVDMRVKRLYCLLPGGGIDVRGCVVLGLFCCFKIKDYSLFSCWFQLWEAVAGHLYTGGDKVLEMAIQVYYSLSTTNSQHLLKTITLIESVDIQITNIEHVQILAKMPSRLLQYLAKKLQYRQKYQTHTNPTNYDKNHERLSIQQKQKQKQKQKGNTHCRGRDCNDDGQLKVVVELIQRQVGFGQVDAYRYWQHVFKTLINLLTRKGDYQGCDSNYVQQNMNQIIEIIDRVMSMLFYKSATNYQQMGIEEKRVEQISLQTYKNALEHVEWQLQHPTLLQQSDRNNTRLQKIGSYLKLISGHLERMPKSMQNRPNSRNMKYQAFDNKDNKNRFGNYSNENRLCFPSNRLLAGLQCRNHILMLLQVLAILLEKHLLVEEVFIIQLFVWMAEGKLVKTTTRNLQQKQSFLLNLFSISQFLQTNNNEKQRPQNEPIQMSNKNPTHSQQLQIISLNNVLPNHESCSSNSQVFEQYEVNQHINEFWPIIRNIKLSTQQFISQYFDFINISQSMEVDELACQVEDLVSRLDVLQERYQTILPPFYRLFVNQIFIKVAKDTLLSI